MKTLELKLPFPTVEELLELAQKESGVLVTQSGQPIAKVLPISHKDRPRVAPLHPGAIEMSPDFNAPLLDTFWLGKE